MIDNHSLRSLSEASGIEIRTIRSWIHQDLLPRPLSAGRDAHYPPETLVRLMAIKVLKELYGMPLAAIRQELLLASPEKIAAFASQAATGAATEPSVRLTETSPGRVLEQPEPVQSTASDYLRALRAKGVFGGKTADASAPALRDPIEERATQIEPLSEGFVEELNMYALSDAPGSNGKSSVARAVALLERLAGERTPRRARGDVVLRIPVTRDVEITVRGHMTPQDAAYYERIADLLREILMGGARHD
jgi:DNA-binding transcriptional MerR regulator